MSSNRAHLVKIVDTRPAEETNVRARHILVRATPGNETEMAAARQKIQTLRQRLANGEDFGQLAAMNSDDTGSGARGGDLGWFGPGAMVPPFEQAAFGARIGEVVGPVETQFGLHLIKVTNRAEVDVRIADFALPLQASIASLETVREKLEDLQFYGEESGDFAAEAERLDVPLQTLQVNQDQRVFAGFGASRPLTRFLEDAEKGDISEVIELNDYYVVARVEEIRPEGYRPFDEVKDELRPRALLEKKKAFVRQRMERAYQAGGFDGLGAQLGTAMRTAENISFGNQLVPGLGRDATFAGTVMGLEEGEDSGVVEGQNGVFVARVTNRTEPPPITDAERERLRNQLLTQRRAAIQNQWIAAQRDKADIEDLRSTFLQ